MIKEYKTIREIASPLMVIDRVEGVTYDELAEIELPNGEVRRCKVLEVDGDRAVVQLLNRHRASTLHRPRCAFSVTRWSLPFPRICSAVSSTAWADPSTAVRI